MIYFTGDPKLFNIIAKDNGFVDSNELLELVSKVSYTEPWRRLAFDGWRKLDGSKSGLLRLIDLTKEK